MASITPYRNGWRAYLYIDGKRETRTFRTQREAHAWAANRERELRGGTTITFADATERWLALKLPTLENPENVRTVEQSIRTHVLPYVGTVRLCDLHRRDLVSVVRRIAEASRIETAHRVGQRIRAILDLAVDDGHIEVHPGAGLSRVLPYGTKRKMPAVRPDELPELLRAIGTYGEQVTRLGLLLLAHTFVRTSELREARWEEIRDPETWVIPAERMKLRLPHVVPLSREVRKLLAELRETTDESPYILASPFEPRAPISKNTLLFALYRLGYRGRMTGHGFRAIASTILNESGLWNPDAIERQLAHSESDKVRDSYLRAEYLEERRRMMEWFSAHLVAARTRSTSS